MPQHIDTIAGASGRAQDRETTTTAPQLTDVTLQSAVPRPAVERLRDSASPDHRTSGKVFAETAPLIGAAALFAPAVSLLLGPWLLLVLLLIGPLALILTVLLATAVAACLLAMVVALIASPYLLIRHLRAHGTFRREPGSHLHLVPTHRVSPGRLGIPEPKGLS